MGASTVSRTSRAAHTDRALRRYVRRTVYPYSSYYRRLLDEAGLGRSGVAAVADLARLPPTALRTVADPGTLVLRPEPSTIRRLGSRWLAGRLLAAQLFGLVGRFNRRVIEPRFKPVHWLWCDGTPVGCSREDLTRLGTLGGRWLDLAGVGRRDVLVSVLPSDASVAHWTLVQGARLAGVAAAHLGADGAAIASLRPTVLAGHFDQLTAVLGVAAGPDRDGLVANLRTVLWVTQGSIPEPGRRARLKELAGDAAVVAAWSPSGVRGVWSECREASRRADPAANVAVHPWPGADIIEVVPEKPSWEPVEAVVGELLWTGVGWTGSAALRIRTGAPCLLASGACTSCGRPGPLVETVGRSPVAAAMATAPGVAAWHAQHRDVNGEAELIISLAVDAGADVVATVRDLDATLDATQYLVLSPAEVEKRIAASGGQLEVSG